MSTVSGSAVMAEPAPISDRAWGGEAPPWLDATVPEPASGPPSESSS